MQIQQTDLDRVRQDFYLRGESVADWARERGFSQSVVYQVLNGRCKALRGDSHRVAVALGLKPQASISASREEQLQENAV